MRLYLDDCAYHKSRVTLLMQEGHAVVYPAQVGLTGHADVEHARYAVDHDLVLVTQDPRDFTTIYSSFAAHPGLLLIYVQNNVTKDMTNSEIVQAIRNLQHIEPDLRGKIRSLNQYRYPGPPSAR